MSIFLISDLHIGHKFVSGLRGFKSADDHDAVIFHALSEALGPRDDLWILGDLSASHHGEAKALSMLKELPGKKHLVCGNHDRVSAIHRDGWKYQEKFRKVFTSIQEFSRRTSPSGKSVLLTHYPYRADHTTVARYDQYRLPDYGAFLFHGHTHQTHVWTSPREIHVGWDTWKRPVPIDELYHLVDNFKTLYTLGE